MACRCGHSRDAHTHFSSRTWCALCPWGACNVYRRRWPWNR